MSTHAEDGGKTGRYSERAKKEDSESTLFSCLLALIYNVRKAQGRHIIRVYSHFHTYGSMWACMDLSNGRKFNFTADFYANLVLFLVITVMSEFNQNLATSDRIPEP